MSIFEREVKLLKRAAHLLNIDPNTIEVDEEDKWIQVDNWVFSKLVSGEWQLVVIIHHPGRWNPYNGGHPPEDEDKEMGLFKFFDEALVEIAKRNAIEAINDIKIAMTQEEIEESNAE